MIRSEENAALNRYSKRDIVFIVIGSLFCVAGLLFNEFTLTRLFNFDSLLSGSIRLTIWAVNIALILWGAITIVYRHRDVVVNLNLALVSLIVVSPFVAEVFIRSAVALNINYFRNPRLYAGWFEDEDHWKLRYLWQPNTSPTNAGFVVDPLLGWTPQKSEGNSLKVLAEAPYTPNFDDKTVLFFGDSFVYGSSPALIRDRIPQLLDRRLADHTIYNYGVPGYGVDQIFLRFKQSHPLFQDPFVIIGILTFNMDRSMFAVHSAPKPYFELENDALVLQGTPLPEDINVWYNQHPPSINSYLLAMVDQKLKLARAGGSELELPQNIPQKKLINGKIIEEMVREAQTHDLPLLFVLFYAQQELEYEGWRELFLKEMFAKLDVPYIDTKEIFWRAMGENMENVSKLYYPENAHPNEFGNCLVAEAIAAYLADEAGFNLTETNINETEASNRLITFDLVVAETVRLEGQLDTPWPIEGAENQQGACADNNFLWLGHGDQYGVSGVIWSTTRQLIRAAFEVAPGPAREDNQRTIELSLMNELGAKTEQRQFDRATVLVFESDLQPGPNRFKLKVLDEPTVLQQPNGDTRPLLVLLRQIRVR